MRAVHKHEREYGMSERERCPHCGQDYEDGLVFCPGCGRRVRQKQGSYVPATPGPSEQILKTTQRAVRAAMVVAVLLGAAFLIFVMPRFKPKDKRPPAVHAPAAPRIEMPSVDETTPVPSKPEPLTEEELAELQAAVEGAVLEYLDNDIRGNFEDMYRAMTPGYQRRLQQIYQDVSAIDGESYAVLRNDTTVEPRVRKIITTGLVKPSGTYRVVIEADVEVLRDQRESRLRFRFVMLDLGDEVWRVDGYEAGPEGPDVFTRRGDLDRDGADETLEFVRDLESGRGRWEVLASDGGQRYVFEMNTCAKKEQSAGKTDDEPVEVKNPNPIRIHPMRKVEQELFRSQFSMWAATVELDDIIERKNPGFEMESGCPDGKKYFVIYFNGAYQEVVYTSAQNKE